MLPVRGARSDVLLGISGSTSDLQSAEDFNRGCLPTVVIEKVFIEHGIVVVVEVASCTACHGCLLLAMRRATLLPLHFC
jgi:hypothetical protein